MKKIVLLIVAFIAFANVSYASFPITDTLEIKQETVQAETVEQYHLRMQKMGFDIQDCRCDDCKKFKGINNAEQNGETREKKKTNYKSLFVTMGVWLVVAAVVFAIWFIWWVARGLENFGNGPSVMS
jgi:flagellar basal body-associated protein FliL